MDKLFQIINGCARQDRQYQKLFYEQYYGLCLKMVFRYVNTYEQALKVTHNGFLRIFRDFSDFGILDKHKKEASLLKWIKDETLEAILDVMKPKMTGAFLPSRPSSPDPFLKYTVRPFSETPLLYSQLITILKKLPPVCRMIFNLYVIDGYSHPEIAKMLGISTRASASYLEKARERCHGLFLSPLALRE